MSQIHVKSSIPQQSLYGAANSARLYVRPNVYLPNGEIDFQTGMLSEAERRTGRTQALRREARQLDAEFAQLKAMLQARANEKGRRISKKAAVGLIVVRRYCSSQSSCWCSKVI